MKDPEANQIPEGFVQMWQEAIKTNSKAGWLFNLYICKPHMFFDFHFIAFQAAKSALFEKWLQAGKDWSMPLEL